MDLQLRDKVFIVTGGSQGLGRATATTLVEEGARVVLSSRTSDAVRGSASQLGPRALGVVADNADPGAAQQLVDSARSRFGRVDGALISVGGPPAATAMAASQEQWQQSVEAILLGGIRIATRVADGLEAGGSILFVLSTSVKAPIANLAISNTLRPALAMFAKTMADELGPRGIRVNGILPGRMATARIEHLDSLADDPAAARQRNAASIPLRRYGDPEEFARVAAFLLSPAASYVTGAMVPVDGGSLRAL